MRPEDGLGDHPVAPHLGMRATVESRGLVMHRFALCAAMAAAFLLGTATADAATRKKPGATADRSAVVAAKPKRHVSRPAAATRNQQWPTSFNDGSFRYTP